MSFIVDKTTQDYLIDFAVELSKQDFSDPVIGLKEIFRISNKYTRLIDTAYLESLRKEIGRGD